MAIEFNTYISLAIKEAIAHNIPVDKVNWHNTMRYAIVEFGDIDAAFTKEIMQKYVDGVHQHKGINCLKQLVHEIDNGLSLEEMDKAFEDVV